MPPASSVTADFMHGSSIDIPFLFPRFIKLRCAPQQFAFLVEKHLYRASRSDFLTRFSIVDDIVEHLSLIHILEDLQPEDIDTDAALFGEGLGLDSIDALELIVLLERNYGIKLKDAAAGKEVFRSVRVMAEDVYKRQN